MIKMISFINCTSGFHQKITPEDIEEEEFQELLKTEEGRQQLEQFHTTKGNPVGGYEKLVDDPFEEWKKIRTYKI